MKSFTVFILLAFIFGGVTQICAVEDVVADVAEAAAPEADVADPLADVAEPAENIADAEEAVAPVLEVVENVAKAVADAAQAAVAAAGAAVPGAAAPAKIASEVINIIKDKIAAFKAALDESKGAHPIFGVAQGLLRPKRSLTALSGGLLPDMGTDDILNILPDITSIDGFDGLLMELVDLIVQKNHLTELCQSALGEENEACAQLNDVETAVKAKLANLTNLVFGFFKNLPVGV